MDVNSTFFRDDIDKNITSISVGNVWLCFYKEALIAVTRVNLTTKKVEAVMVTDGSLIPIAFSAYEEWMSNWRIEGQKIARDFGMEMGEFTKTDPVEIQATALHWIADQISQIVDDRLTG